MGVRTGKLAPGRRSTVNVGAREKPMVRQPHRLKEAKQIVHEEQVKVTSSLSAIAGSRWLMAILATLAIAFGTHLAYAPGRLPPVGGLSLAASGFPPTSISASPANRPAAAAAAAVAVKVRTRLAEQFGRQRRRRADIQRDRIRRGVRAAVRQHGDHDPAAGASPAGERRQRTLEFYDAKPRLTRRSRTAPACLRTSWSEFPPGAHVLDLGCGGGWHSAQLRDAGFVVTAVDGSAGLAAEVKRRWAIDVRVMGFDQLDDINAFDGVWASASLHHARAEQLPGIFATIRRATKTAACFTPRSRRRGPARQVWAILLRRSAKTR